MVERVCVFCGSRTGDDPLFHTVAEELGRELVAREIGLVYGGGGIGLMGGIADAVLAAEGEVIGVIPEGLAQPEVMHAGVSDMRVVTDMHERKALMHTLCGAYIALPGGVGTYEELFEVVAWRQLKIHDKPIGLLDTRGYFQDFDAMIDRCIEEGFLKEKGRDLTVRESDPRLLLDRLLS